MANEITWSCAMAASKNGASITNSGSGNADVAGTEMISSVQTFTTSEAAVSLGGCDSVQALCIKNLDATNNLVIGYANPIVTILSTIPPGKAILVWNVTTTLYGKSSASTVDAFVAAVET